ncbi:unnamed protein product [Arabidopsis halleri]
MYQVLGNCQYDIEMLQYQKHNLKDLDMKLIWGHWPFYYWLVSMSLLSFDSALTLINFDTEANTW